MGRNFKLEAQNLLVEFEKGRRADLLQNAKIVRNWHRENPNPTREQFSKFNKDLWNRVYGYCNAYEKRFGRVFLDYVLKERCKSSTPAKKDISGPWKPLDEKQRKILEQRRIDKLVPGIVKLLRSGKVKPLSS